MNRTTPVSGRSDILVSPGFLVGLCLLLLNDYCLKQTIPGLITGKLSDFAGLFVFGLIAVQINPRYSSILLALVGLLFFVWKSDLSDYFIILWNLNGVLLIGRTIDYTDVVALTVLPFAQKYSRTYKPLRIKSLFVYPVLAITVFSIMGTSPARYGTRMDVSEKHYKNQTKNTEPKNSSEAIKIIHDTAISSGLTCISCKPTGFHNKYEGKGVLLEVNYDSDGKMVYIGIYSQDPYRTKYEEQKIAVEKVREELEEALEGHSYNTQKPDETAYFDPYFEAKLRIKSPTVGFPFSSEYNGPGNKDIATAHAHINEYLEAHGFRRSYIGHCYPVDSEFEKQMCRTYIAGRIIGPTAESVSSEITLSGTVDWFGTYLYVEFQKVAEDGSVNLNSIATELQNQLKVQLSKDVEINYEIKKPANKRIN